MQNQHTNQYSDAKLLCAYRKAITTKTKNGGPARIFHDYLSANGTNGGNGVPRPRLMAVRVERRTVAIAVFSGTHLEGWRVRQLSSDPAKAAATTSGFMREVVSEHDCPSVAIESVSGESMRTGLHRAVVDLCRSTGISVWEVSKQSVVDSMAYPPPKSRAEVRLNRNALFAGGLRPHAYCLPVAKREQDRWAVRKYATSHSNKFFLGTDSAPHPRKAKESACGCAGIFNAPFALESYVQVFEEEGALDRFEAFASENGPRFYGLPLNEGTITLERAEAEVPAEIEGVVPFHAGETLRWRLKD